MTSAARLGRELLDGTREKIRPLSVRQASHPLTSAASPGQRTERGSHARAVPDRLDSGPAGESAHAAALPRNALRSSRGPSAAHPSGRTVRGSRRAAATRRQRIGATAIHRGSTRPGPRSQGRPRL
jgi:hypothetical protein